MSSQVPSNNPMIKVPCHICKVDIPLPSMKEHLIGICIPWCLTQYGLEEYIPCLDLSLLADLSHLKRKNIKLMKKIQKLRSFNNKTDSPLFNPTIKQEKFTELTADDISEPNNEINSNNNHPININPTLKPTIINSVIDTNTNNSKSSINNIRDVESLYTPVEEDSAHHDERHLTSSFKSQTGRIYKLCTNSVKQTTRVELFVGNISLIICKPSHLGDTIALNIIRSSFGIKPSDNLTKAPLKGSDWNGACSKCGIKCTSKFRAKPSGLPDLNPNFKLYCCFAHMVFHLLNLNVNTWKDFYEKAKRDQEESITDKKAGNKGEMEDEGNEKYEEKEEVEEVEEVEEEEEDTSDIVNHRPLKKSKTCSTAPSITPPTTRKPPPKPKEATSKKRGKTGASKKK